MIYAFVHVGDNDSMTTTRATFNPTIMLIDDNYGINGIDDEDPE